MELNQELCKEINLERNELYIEQKSFLESDIGKGVNAAIDIGLKALLPNFIENEVIDIKNAILENGFKEGLKEAINSGIDIGKSISGIVTGNFENISQVEMAVKKGGILDKISDVLDYSINIANKKDVINNNVSSILKQGKNSIINAVSDKIEERLTNQVKSVEKLEKYCENWNKYYEQKDFDKMEKTYKNISKYLKETIPIENIIKEARKIENLHNLVKSKNEDFEVSPEQLELAEKLA